MSPRGLSGRRNGLTVTCVAELGLATRRPESQGSQHTAGAVQGTSTERGPEGVTSEEPRDGTLGFTYHVTVNLGQMGTLPRGRRHVAMAGPEFRAPRPAAWEPLPRSVCRFSSCPAPGWAPPDSEKKRRRVSPGLSRAAPTSHYRVHFRAPGNFPEHFSPVCRRRTEFLFILSLLGSKQCEYLRTFPVLFPDTYGLRCPPSDAPTWT